MSQTIQQLDYTVNVLRPLLWQYNQADNLRGLLELKQVFYDREQRDFWQNWYRDVFDLRTANDFGLTVWSIILNFPVNIETTRSPNDYMAIGFNTEVGISPTNNSISNFSNGNFATPADSPLEGLSTEHRRLVLRIRAFNLMNDATVPSINRMLSVLFPNQGAYLEDGNDMTLTYHFTTIDARLRFLFTEVDILPRPSATRYSVEVP